MCALFPRLPSFLSTMVLHNIFHIKKIEKPLNVYAVHRLFIIQIFTLRCITVVLCIKLGLVSDLFKQKSYKFDSLTSALNWFIPYVLQSTIVLHLKVNINIMNNHWRCVITSSSSGSLKEKLLKKECINSCSHDQRFEGSCKFNSNKSLYLVQTRP